MGMYSTEECFMTRMEEKWKQEMASNANGITFPFSQQKMSTIKYNGKYSIEEFHDRNGREAAQKHIANFVVSASLYLEPIERSIIGIKQQTSKCN